MSDLRERPEEDIEREAARVAEQMLHRARLASGVARIFARVGKDVLEQSSLHARVYLQSVAQTATKSALAQLGPEGEAIAEKGFDDLKRFAKAAALAAADVATAEIERARSAPPSPVADEPNER